MIDNLFIFIVALSMVLKGATMATVHAARLARSFSLPKYTVGFIVVAIISIMPEAFIAINSALEGVPSFGLGMLLGSNVADMTLVVAIVVFFAGRNLKIEGKILKNNVVYPYILLLPIVLGFNGHFSRMEGVALIIAGGVFYYLALRKKEKVSIAAPAHEKQSRIVISAMLLFSMAVLILGSHFTVTSAVELAEFAGISPVLIGILIVGLGTTMPELFFALKSARGKDDSLAVGDLLGTVLADATVLVGVLALIAPFSFPPRIVYVTGLFMVVSSFILFHFMKTGRNLTRKEARLLLFFWLIFVLVEFFVNK